MNKHLNVTNLALLSCCVCLSNATATTSLSQELRQNLEVSGMIVQDGTVVTGTIVDEFGEPILGANVVVKGEAGVGTTTDMDGKFSLDLNGLKSSVLVVSYLGYTSQEVVVGNKKVFNITLKEDSKALEEVVVIGYGKNSKRNLTSAISTVSADDVVKVPVPNVTNALAGRAAGLIVTQSGGGLDNSTRVSIRGGGTPLVVIDGYISPYDDFVNMNADDIESMSLLKDAAAAAVYGARAGDGVIVIKTKSGAKGVHVDYTFNQSWGEPTNMKKKLNSFERASFDNTVRDTYGLEARWTPEEIEKYRTGSDPYNYPDSDFQELFLRNFAPEQKHTVSIKSGSDLNKLYASFQAYDQGSIYRESCDSYKRYNARLNDEVTFDQIGLKLTMGAEAHFANRKSPLSAYSSGYWHTWGHIQNSSPMQLAYNKFGQPYVGPDNPAAELSSESGYSKSDFKTLTGNFNAEWNVYGVEGLKVRAGGNYRFFQNDIKQWNKTATQYDLEGNPGPATQTSLKYLTGNSREWTMQYFADYARTFKDAHEVSATLGFEQTYGFSTNFNALRKNYIFMIDQIGAGPSSSMENGGGEAEWGRAGLVARASYNYKKKYFIEGSLRHDGSDLFPEDKRWGNFFAGSAAWAVSEESFFQPLKDRNILNYLKVRATFGQTGLDGGVGRFAYLTSYGLTERGYVLDGKIVPTFSEGALVSPDITWYTRNTFDIGLDFNSLGERLSGSFDYFYMKTTGYLTTPSAVNYTDPLGLTLPKVKSDGEHRRAGYEFNLAWKDHVADFNYEVGVNFTYFNELVSKAWDEDLAHQKNPYKRYVQQVGYWGEGYRNLGFYQNSDQALQLPRRDGSYDLVAGDIIYKDLNGDGKIDGDDQWRIGKNAFPRGNYGVYANLSWKGFSANILFQGSTSRDLYLGDMIRGNGTGGYATIYPFQLDYWTPENRDAMYPRIAMNSDVNGNNNYVQSDYWMVNGRYLRLKSLYIGYDFRHKLLKDVKWLYKCQIGLSGQNLFTISPATKYGFDPETGDTNNYAYPVPRVYAISLNLGF